ncbi:MAG TPA: LacI family DNA-binding transcriptional regulator [Allosphingosinicella sp.]|jgi:LacI family transcriptional regulator
MGEATIRDVARRAEVSVASVSRALNGLDNVSAETRDRVMAAATELGYVPHAGARSLSLARAHTIGVVLPDLHGEFFSEIVRGMDREASRHGYLLLLSNMHAGDEQAGTALRAMWGRVDGLLVMAPHVPPELLDKALPGGLPALLINTPAVSQPRPRLRLDNLAGAEAVVRHLVATGRTRIAHISGPEGNIDAAERAEGYTRALAANAPGAEPLIIPGDFTEEAGEAAAQRILSGEIACDAVFAGNDMMAVGCLHALRSAGADVPGEVAIAGFDDIPIARYLGLTTVQVRIAELGARAVRRLIDLLTDRAEDEADELHRPALVVRATTGRQ